MDGCLETTIEITRSLGRLKLKKRYRKFTNYKQCGNLESSHLATYPSTFYRMRLQVMGLNILIVRDQDDQRIALCNLLNATFSEGHFFEARTIAEAVALGGSFKEPPEMILTDIDVSDMSIEAMQWIKVALPTSRTITLINHKDDDTGITKTEASALMFKYQVIPFLTKFFDNMGGTIRRPGLADKPEGTLTHQSDQTNAGFNGFMRRVFSQIVLSYVNRTKTER